MKVREKIHEIIDSNEDEQTLKSYLSLISRLNELETGSLYNSLSKEQKEELTLSHNESQIDSNLLSHSDIKASYAKWL